MKHLILLSLLLSLSLSSNVYTRVIHTTDPDARCLDGSPPLLYYNEGTEANKFLIYFVGGGLCAGLTLQSTLSDCYSRSSTMLGGSAQWPQMFDGSKTGILSTNPNQSNFSSYNKFIFGYCDGSMHQGHRNSTISFRGKNLYFRGAKNTRSNLQWIVNKYPAFKNASQVVVTGTSAGGTATFLWTNYIRNLVSNASNVISIIDSGVFLSFNTYQTNISYIQMISINNFNLANVDEKTPLDLCNLRYPGEQYKCLNIYYAFTSFQSRTLLVGSEYDQWVINNILKINCIAKGHYEYTLANCTTQQLAYIQSYRTQFKKFMNLFTMNSKNSVWSIGCSYHGYTETNTFFDSEHERVPTGTGPKIRDAVNTFVLKGERVIAEESQAWPANTGCAK